MKKKSAIILFLLFACIGISRAESINAKLITITFKYSFIHEGEGKDINTRLKIYVDDVVKGVSLAKKEADANAVTIEIPNGFHRIRAVIESEFEGVWEEHIVANEYSIDCVYLSEMDFVKNVRVELLFDLEKGTIVKNVETKAGTFNSPF